MTIFRFFAFIVYWLEFAKTKLKVRSKGRLKILFVKCHLRHSLCNLRYGGVFKKKRDSGVGDVT